MVIPVMSNLRRETYAIVPKEQGRIDYDAGWHRGIFAVSIPNVSIPNLTQGNLREKKGEFRSESP